MTKARTSLTLAYMIPVVGLLVLSGVFSDARLALAECPLPPGVTPPDDPSVTAQQVEDGSATLMDFALVAKDQFQQMSRAGAAEVYHFGCLLRQEGGPWRSGSTYLVQLTLDGRVFVHAKEMALSGRLLDRRILAEILSSLGVELTVLANLASPDSAIAAQAGAAVLNTLLQEPHAPFDATTPIPGLRPGIPGASGYASVYIRARRPDPIILLAGFDLDASHVVSEEIDYGAPAVTAEDVVDRESLKAFVTEAGHYFIELFKTGGRVAISQAKVAMRDPDGPWRHGSVYLYVLDLASNIILFHGANPDRYELRPLIATVRDVVTGELILPQVIEAAKSSPEGGFVEYYFDDPTDDTDSADIPKVGYAREFKRAVSSSFIVGSGFYGSAPDDVSTGPRTEVEVTVLGDAVEDLTVAFSRSTSGRPADYAWSASTDANGQASLTISSADGVSGYYQARARNADGEVVGQWHSIPLNRNQRQVLELTLGGRMRIVSVESLDADGTETATDGLVSNVPNPFNPSTQITYRLGASGAVRLRIYNTLGQVVRTLVHEVQPAGRYQVVWEGRDERGVAVASGVYLARLIYPGGVQTRQLLLVK